jgi:hypothetical protein
MKIMGDCKNYSCDIDRIKADSNTCNIDCINFMPIDPLLITDDEMECPYCGCYISNILDNGRYITQQLPIRTRCITCKSIVLIDRPPNNNVVIYKGEII